GAAELAGDAHLDQPRAEAFLRISHGRRTASLYPTQQQRGALIADGQIDPAVLSRKSTILGGVGGKFVEHERQRGRGPGSNSEVVAGHDDPRAVVGSIRTEQVLQHAVEARAALAFGRSDVIVGPSERLDHPDQFLAEVLYVGPLANRE